MTCLEDVSHIQRLVFLNVVAALWLCPSAQFRSSQKEKTLQPQNTQRIWFASCSWASQFRVESLSHCLSSHGSRSRPAHSELWDPSVITVSPHRRGAEHTEHTRVLFTLIKKAQVGELTDLVMRTALSWWAMPFSGMLFPSPWWDKSDFCHLQKLSRDLSAWWLISRFGCSTHRGERSSEKIHQRVWSNSLPQQQLWQ